MSDDINKGIIIGRLVRDAELSFTSSGYAMCKISIAVNKSKKVNDSWEEEAHFFDAVLWGKRGESLVQYLKKGSQIGVEYTLKQDRWEKDGVKKSRVTLDVQNIQLLGGKPNQQQQGQYNPQQGNALAPEFQQNGNPEQFKQQQQQNNNGYQNYQPPKGQAKDYEDDIPFSCNYC